jgi:hypothetical protein
MEAAEAEYRCLQAGPAECTLLHVTSLPTQNKVSLPLLTMIP